MKKILFGAALFAAAAVPMQAQESVITGKPSVFSITPYVGYIRFGDLFKFSPGVSQSYENKPLFGGQAQIDVSRNVALVGNFGYAKTRAQIKNDNTGSVASNSGNLGFWLYDGDVQLKLPMSMGDGAVTPFVQGGVGATRVSSDFNNIQSTSQTTVAFNGGAGVDFAISGVGVRLMAKDYMTNLDWQQLGDVSIDRDARKKTAHNIALTAGLKFAF